jgi:hypothetical protein
MRSSEVRLTNPKRRRRAVHQAGLPLGPEAARPLARGALAHLGGRGRLGERPSFSDNPPGQQATLVQAERGVSAQFHPVPPIGTEWPKHLSASKEARMNNLVRDYN